MNLPTAGDESPKNLKRLEFSQAIRQIMALADRANQYIDEKKPWAAAKDPARASRSARHLQHGN